MDRRPVLRYRPHRSRVLHAREEQPSYDRRCSVDGCENKHYGRGLCEKHYRRWRRTGSVHVIARPDSCSVEGCERPVDANGLCHGHDQRVRRNGDADPGTPLGRRRQDPVCSVEGCDRESTAHGWCRTHNARYERHGDVLPDIPVRTAAGEGYEQHGYWYVPVPPEQRWLTSGETPAAEHRLRMAEFLGRPLEPDEVVHHRNGNRMDNRIENLELWSVYQPKGQRTKDKVAYALEILRRYAPELLIDGSRSPGTEEAAAPQDSDLSPW